MFTAGGRGWVRVEGRSCKEEAGLQILLLADERGGGTASAGGIAVQRERERAFLIADVVDYSPLQSCGACMERTWRFGGCEAPRWGGEFPHAQSGHDPAGRSRRAPSSSQDRSDPGEVG